MVGKAVELVVRDTDLSCLLRSRAAASSARRSEES